jgi:spore coat polysaccharide biosynthesis protein SpsF
MVDENNITAIIQARVGSTRLPGKALMDIEGKPMLWHVINRIKCSKYINKILIATTTNKKDDQIENFCKNYGIEFYRGMEDDVLDRYYQAAKLWKANTIVRICSDNPLIDPQIIDKVISSYLENKDILNGASTNVHLTYPLGLNAEVISFSTLEKVWQEAKKDYQREHVTIYIYENPNNFKINSVENEKNISHFHWTVDEYKDLKFIREIYKILYKKKNIFLIKDILNLLEREPYLKEINKNSVQKEIIR